MILTSASFGTSKTGLLLVGYRPIGADGSYLAVRQTTGITEVGSGIYRATYNAPVGTVAVAWDTGEGTTRYSLDAGIVHAASLPSPAPVGYGGWTGAGARTVTVTVNDGATALQNAFVRLTEGGNTFYGLTNVSGQLTFNVNDATYTVSITKDHYTFAGATLVVDGPETPTYSMTAITIPAPAYAAQTTAYITTRNETGDLIGNQPVQFQLLRPSLGNDSYSRDIFTVSSNGSGLLQKEILKSATYRARREKGDWVTFTTGTADTFELPQILGRIPS